MFTGRHKTQRMVSALTLLERYHEYGDEILNYNVGVTGAEIWASFVNVEIKGQSKECMYPIHQTSRKSLNKCSLPES
jgi:hypothetical protein